MRKKFGRILASIVSLVVMAAFSVGVLSVVHFATMERVEAREAERSASRLSEAFPEAESFTRLEGIELLPGVLSVYEAGSGEGYVMELREKAILREHDVVVAMADDGRILDVFTRDEAASGAEPVSEEVLNAFTKTMGNYNAPYTADLMSRCVDRSKEQLALLTGEEDADE